MRLGCQGLRVRPCSELKVCTHRCGGLERKHWSNAGPIRTIFKGAFTASGLQYFNPHSFRKTLALLGGELCQTPEQYKAWSQNLGHEHVLTTFTGFGNVSSHAAKPKLWAMT